MDRPDDNSRRTPRDRFRNILSADRENESVPEARKPAVVNLPKAAPGSAGEAAISEGRPDELRPGRGAMSAAQRLPTFWTAGSILSILANLILLLMLVSTWTGLSAFGRGGGAMLLSAYRSLEQLDQAHIRATVPVQTSIAFDTTVPVQSSTNITLARDVYMEGAHVTINTALFNIDAPANITLPAGTSLDVTLDMTLPMETIVPITMEIPVDIAVRDTDLHAAIQGLKDSLKPPLCAASPMAMLPDGSAICR